MSLREYERSEFKRWVGTQGEGLQWAAFKKREIKAKSFASAPLTKIDPPSPPSTQHKKAKENSIHSMTTIATSTNYPLSRETFNMLMRSTGPDIDYSDRMACMEFAIDYLENGKYMDMWFRNRIHPDIAIIVSTRIYDILRINNYTGQLYKGVPLTDAAMARRLAVGLCGSDSDAREMMKLTPQHFTDKEFNMMHIRRPKAKAL